METIGIIGLGTMGIKVSEKLSQAGYRLFGYDVSNSNSRRAAELGVAITDGLRGVAEPAETILMLLPGPDQVAECVFGSDGLLASARKGTVLIDMSTVDPASTRRLAQAAEAKGNPYLDAPILGRPATVGNWALPVGGSAEALERSRKILENLASQIFHVGASGAGNTVKLLNQLMFGAINAMAAEMMAVAQKLGIAPKMLYEIIAASRAATVSNLFLEVGSRISEDRYDDPTFTVDLLSKDIRLAVQMAKEGNAPPVLGRTVELINELARTQGFGAKDTSVMWKSYLKMWGAP